MRLPRPVVGLLLGLILILVAAGVGFLVYINTIYPGNSLRDKLIAWKQNDTVQAIQPDGVVTNKSTKTQWAVVSLKPLCDYEIAPGKGFDLILRPKKGYTGKTYKAAPLPMNAENYLIPLAPGESIGGRGIDTEAGYDFFKADYYHIPGDHAWWDDNGNFRLPWLNKYESYRPNASEPYAPPTL